MLGGDLAYIVMEKSLEYSYQMTDVRLSQIKSNVWQMIISNHACLVLNFEEINPHPIHNLYYSFQHIFRWVMNWVMNNWCQHNICINIPNFFSMTVGLHDILYIWIWSIIWILFSMCSTQRLQCSTVNWNTLLMWNVRYTNRRMPGHRPV